MVPMVKTFLDILGALGSSASLEAEIRTAVSSPSAEQAKEKLQRINIVEDFSDLPSEVADILDTSNIQLSKLKRELQGGRFFADGEKAAIVSQIYARNPKFSAYKGLIDPLIQDYLDHVEKYLLEMMSPGEKILHADAVHIRKELQEIRADIHEQLSETGSRSVSIEAPQKSLYERIAEIKAQLPENHMERRLVSHKTALLDSFERILLGEKALSFVEAVRQNRFLLLMGDAGQGKSVELKYLACRIFDSGDIPFLYPLSHYSGGDLLNLLPGCYNKIASDKLFLIFDGYDEMCEPERREFLRRLSTLRDTYPDIHVILSSRSNFCNNEVERQSQTFRDFLVYDLDELSQEDVNGYLAANGIDCEIFFTKASAKGIQKLLYNPFYLDNLVKLYQKEGNLPPKNLVMQELIMQGFELDDGKFQEDLEANRRRLYEILERVAISMQLMRVQQLDDVGEYQMLFSMEERELLKYSGLLKKAGNGWAFTHNIFKEYLAASFLSRRGKEEVLSYISQYGELFDSWVNTLGFLVNMDLSWDIRAWLLECCPNALVKFEPERLTDEIKLSIIKSAFEKCDKDMLWINDRLLSVQELAVSCCCEDVLDFLLNRIKDPVNWVSQISAIEAIRYLPRLYGRKKEIADLLLQYCAAPPEGRESMCYHALQALSSQKMVDDVVAQTLVELYAQTDDCYIRATMYTLLKENGYHNRYWMYYVDGIKHNYAIGRSTDEIIALKDGLSALTDPAAIQGTLLFLLGEHEYCFYGFDSAIETLCDNAARLYMDGNQTFFSLLIDCYFEAEKNGLYHQINHILKFFNIVSRFDDAVVEICNRSTRISALAPLLRDQTRLEYVKQAYIEGRLNRRELFYKVIEKYADQAHYDAYRQLVQDTDGIYLSEREPQISWGEVDACAAQEFVNTLFHKEKSKALISKLSDEVQIAEPTVANLKETAISQRSVDPVVQKLRYAIQRFYSDKAVIANLVDSDGWSRFVLCSVSDMIGSYTDIIFSDDQKQELKEMLKVEYASGITDHAVHYRDSNIISVAYPYIFALTVYLEYVPDEKHLLKMIELPYFSFSFPGQERKEQKYAFLEAHVPQDVLQKYIVDDLNSRRVHDMVQEDHFDFCREHMCEEVREAAIEAALDHQNSELVQSSAIQYLYTVFGPRCIEKQILPNADGKLLIMVQRICTDISTEKLKTAMEREFQKAANNELMTRLIILESCVAIEAYINFTENEKRIPDGPRGYPDGPTGAIAQIRDHELLPYLEKLLTIAVKPGFQDGDFCSLYSSLDNAFVECGCLEPDSILRFLNGFKQSHSDNEKAFRFCSFAVDAIRHRTHSQHDAPMKIESVKEIIAS